MNDTAVTEAGINDMRLFFGYKSAAAFAKDWRELTSIDKLQLKQGIGNGSFAY